jgi:hypothetical protein
MKTLRKRLSTFIELHSTEFCDVHQSAMCNMFVGTYIFNFKNSEELKIHK